VLFEIPSNLLLKRFKPHVWLSLNMFLFGFTTIMEGVVKNYSGLLAVRFFLGVFETGMVSLLYNRRVIGILIRCPQVPRSVLPYRNVYVQ